MAKQPSKVANIAINTVALEDDANSVSLQVTQQTPEVTALADVGPRRVVDNYDFTLNLEGAADFASGQSDATLAGLIGDDGVAMAFDPTGKTADADNPNYDATSVVLGSYSVTARVGQGVQFSAELRGNSALDRAVA